MDRSPITPDARRCTNAEGPLKIMPDARRAAGVRPPDDRDPETLPASAIQPSTGNAGDTDINDLAPHEPCRVRIVNVGHGRVAVAHAAGPPVAELGSSSYVEILLDTAALVLVRQA